MSELTESQIRERATAQSFQRGEEYYQDGRVGAFSYRDGALQAVVEGSGTASYRVDINLTGAVIFSATCTCPYEGTGDCKHIVAVLLTFIRHSRVEVAPAAPSPDDLLKQMTADQLRQVITMLRQQKPELEDWLRVVLPGMITPIAPAEPVERKVVTKADTVAFRRQVLRAIDLLDYYNHWQSIEAVVNALDDAHSQAQTFLERGDFNNALALMRIIGEEVASQYGDIEEECQLAAFLEEWSQDFTTAILGADLSDSERQMLSEEMDSWAVELTDYGLDEVMDGPISACMQTGSSSSVEMPSSNLTNAWLDVMAYKGDDDAYLAACLQRGAHYRYAYRLAELGRVDEVVAHVAQHALRSDSPFADGYLHLAQFLEQQGHVEAAYQIGLQGISRTGKKPLLATWVAEQAEKLGELKSAQHAWHTAFTASPSLGAYQQLKRLSGEDWSALRSQLIAHAEGQGSTDVLIEIAIEDQDIEQAVHLWDSLPYGSYQLLDQLVAAAADSQPDWAAQQAVAEARKLINRGSKYYPHAVRWLGKVRDIYMRQNRHDDWDHTRAAIRTEHGRKYSLMQQLDRL